MKFGSRKRLGAASIPEIAPSTAARPQPSASIHVTRTPSSRASGGIDAAARIASPSFVYWNIAHSTTTVASTTPIVPMSWIEIATPRDVDRAGRERALHGAHLAPTRSSVARPLSASRRPMVTITTRQLGALARSGG